MYTLRVTDILNEPILVSRESARLLESTLRTTMATASGRDNNAHKRPLIIDFEGVSGIAPSFIDELLTMLESIVRNEANDREWEIVVANPPTRLSLKFEAVARGHGMVANALADGSWALTGIQNAPS